MSEENNYELEGEESVKKVLREVPQKKRTQREKIMAIKVNEKEHIMKNKFIENGIRKEVSSEMTTVEGKVKQVHGNKEKRDLETEFRCNKNVDYMKNKKVIDDRIKEVWDEESLLEYLRDILNAAIALTRLGGN